MRKTILEKRYLKIIFKNQSPLAIGGEEGDLTDQNVLRDSKGNPYIPGSALAGVYRRLFTEDKKGEGDAKKYFGPKIEGEKGDQNKAEESQIVTYDATIQDAEKKHTIIRDMVALEKENKVAKRGAKFDLEAIATGTTFVTYVEWNITEKNERNNPNNPLAVIADAYRTGDLYIGSKTERGYGQIKAEVISYKEFQLRTEQGATGKDLDDWLKFSMYDENQEWCSFTQTIGKTDKHKQERTIVLHLKQVGGIAIRRYTTTDGKADYEQLTIRRNDETQEKPVIPGTSWAGAFRSQIYKLNSGLDLEEYFGKANSKSEESRKSEIRFSESVIEGAKPQYITRNAIDRFTNATLDHALYTEKTWYEGKTDLTITLGKKIAGDETFCSVLSAAIADLHEGYLSVGGLTAVGRGLFTIENIKLDQVGINTDGTSICDMKKELAADGNNVSECTDGEIVYQWLRTELKNGKGVV